MEITEEMLKKCFSKVQKIAKEKSRIDLMFDGRCSEYFGIDDFPLIYQNHDEIVDSLVYGTGSLSWESFLKVVENYKKELKGKSE